MAPPEGVRTYLANGIEGTPAVLSSLLKDWSDDDPRWDDQPDPDRFTLREVLAHVADWDPIFIKRVERMRDEENPFLESVDEGELATNSGYGMQSAGQNLMRLHESRPQLVALIRSLKDDQWDRTGHRELVGDVSMFDLVVMILGHDTYHTRQVAEYLARE